MKSLLSMALFFLVSYAKAASVPIYSDLVDNERVSKMFVKAVDIEISGQTCNIDDGNYAEGSSFRVAYRFICTIDLESAAAPLIAQGFEFGDLRTRDLGGAQSSNGVEVRPIGWQFELKQMPVGLFVDAKATPDRSQARAQAITALSSGKLKVRLTFAKIVCSAGGNPVEKLYGDCPPFLR